MNIAKIAIAFALFSGLTACANNVGKLTMDIPPPSHVNQALKQTIAVGTVSSGSHTVGYSDRISDDDFKAALQKTLAIHSLLASDAASATWIVDAEREPKSTLNIPWSHHPVETTVVYKILKKSDRQNVFQDTIRTSSSSSTEDGGNEYDNAVRSNLVKFANKLDNWKP
jgi:hypothetical protein